MDDRIPYCYLVGWSKIDVWYYGVRYAKGCNPNDFWKTYFTSSERLVPIFRLLYGEPNVIQIRRTFDSAEKAKQWESKVLRRLKITKKPNKWLNLHDTTKMASETENQEAFIWINNGKINLKWLIYDELPETFRIGKI